MLRIFVVLLMFTGLAGCGDVPEATSLTGVRKVTASDKVPRMCEMASAVAVGFGEQNVVGLAGHNLDIEINKLKDSLVRKGAKGFTVENRKVACEDYIDFGGAIGHEHLCRSSAMVCGQTPT